MLKEFREFAVKGNMVDLAVGLVLGAAFGSIVGSLVKDIFAPIVGLLAGKVDFANRYIVLSGVDYTTLDETQKHGAVTLNYGLFINALINFVIVAFAMFFVVKAINRLKREAPPAPEAPAEPSGEEKLLGEIRDLLKSKA